MMILGWKGLKLVPSKTCSDPGGCKVSYDISCKMLNKIIHHKHFRSPKGSFSLMSCGDTLKNCEFILYRANTIINWTKKIGFFTLLFEIFLWKCKFLSKRKPKDTGLSWRWSWRRSQRHHFKTCRQCIWDLSKTPFDMDLKELKEN